MKKILAIALAAIGTILMSICSVSCSHSCDENSYNVSDDFTAQDSAVICNIAAQVINPEFTSVDEYLVYTEDMQSWYDNIVIMAGLSKECIGSIADVVFKERGCITTKDIVQEYLRHKQVYDSVNNITSNPPTTSSLEPDTIGRGCGEIVAYEHMTVNRSSGGQRNE